MNEANRLKLGGFLLISITLLIIGFVSIGITKLFEPRYRAMTVLNTSVEGLAVGSPVKYLGLPVGKITAMTMRQKDGYIAVYFDIFPSTVEQDEDLPPGTVGTNFATVMQQKNLSCFIASGGPAPRCSRRGRHHLHSVAPFPHRQRDPEHQPDA